MKTHRLCHFIPLLSSHTRNSPWWASQSSNTIYKKRNVGVLSPAGVWLQAFCWGIFGEVIKASMKRWYTTAGDPSNVNIYMSRRRDVKPFQSRLLFFGILFQRWYFPARRASLRLRRWNAAQKSRDTSCGCRHDCPIRRRGSSATALLHGCASDMSSGE